MDEVERALLAGTVHSALAAGSAGEPADAALDEIGWRDMLDAEAADAIAIVFTALGATNRNATALDDVVAYGLGLEPRPTLAVVLPPFAVWHPPGARQGDRITAVGLATARVLTAGEMLVACDAGGDPSAVVVAAGSAGVTRIQGIDPDAGLHHVRVDTPPASAAAVDVGPWDEAVGLAQRAVAYQTLGACRATLDLARAHAVERVQFGRPIARFQAVRHRLAEALVALEALDAALTAARDEPAPLTAALAKAIAGRTARTVAAHSQQVLAGIGFTTDHPFHRYVKRTAVLDGLFGSADDLVRDIGRGLLATRTVPTLIEL